MAHKVEDFMFYIISFSGARRDIHITSEYLGHEAKAVLAGSKMEALEAENAKLKRDLIFAMDEANTTKEKAKALVDNLKV